jgi:hypothetical protein
MQNASIYGVGIWSRASHLSVMQNASIYGVGIWSRASHLSVIVAEVGDDAKDGVIVNRCVADDAGPRHLTGDGLRCGIQNSRSLHTDMISTEPLEKHTLPCIRDLGHAYRAAGAILRACRITHVHLR